MTPAAPGLARGAAGHRPWRAAAMLATGETGRMMVRPDRLLPPVTGVESVHDELGPGLGFGCLIGDVVPEAYADHKLAMAIVDIPGVIDPVTARAVGVLVLSSFCHRVIPF